jgi:predicted SnoaL-like aldol condensation-catalyzing enzyme
MNNREVFERSLAEFLAGNVEVLRTVLREDFVTHSPGAPSGRDGFFEFMTSSSLGQARFEVKRIIADDEYMVVHHRMIPPGDEAGVAVVDIWRMEDGLIVEHWDVKQPMPEPSTVPNGMF